MMACFRTSAQAMATARARVELQISKYHAFHYLGTPRFDW